MLWAHSQSKLELNLKEVELEWCKNFTSCFALKVRLQVLKFTFCHVKLG